MHYKAILLQKTTRRQVMQSFLDQLSWTFRQNCFRPLSRSSLGCCLLIFSLENKNILKAVKTACISTVFFMFALTVATSRAVCYFRSRAALTSRTQALPGLDSTHILPAHLFQNIFIITFVSAKRRIKPFTNQTAWVTAAQPSSDAKLNLSVPISLP